MLARAILCTVYVGALCHFYALHKTELYAAHKIYINLALCGRYAGFMNRVFHVTGGRVLLCRFYVAHKSCTDTALVQMPMGNASAEAKLAAKSQKNAENTSGKDVATPDAAAEARDALSSGPDDIAGLSGPRTDQFIMAPAPLRQPSAGRPGAWMVLRRYSNSSLKISFFVLL